MILGTAGHVDHGKTSLVRALTGVDLDRLPEEKQRGMTIELGFAHLTLPRVGQVGVIDVPGHERFVRTMAAGAGGVDCVLLVVAADEGVRPQTREHVAVCRLLGVPSGVVVVTKADLLPARPPSWAAELSAALDEVTAGTVFAGAPRVEVSAHTGAGLEQLRGVIDQQLAALQPGERLGRPFFMPIDRAFSVKGAGLVVTGTVLGGRVRADDAVWVVPGHQRELRVRTVQGHGAQRPEATVGQRAALGLPDLRVEDVHRGQVVTGVGVAAARRLDVELVLLPGAPSVGRRFRAALTLGTAQREVVGRLVDAGSLSGGQQGWAQLHLSSPVAALPGQRFVLRGPSGTVGGGRVLAVDAPRRRMGGRARLEALAANEPRRRVEAVLLDAGYKGVSEAALALAAGVEVGALAGALGDAGARAGSGARGDAGATGVAGAQGDVGPRGDAGAQGDAGARGGSGAQGDAGARGGSGAQGDVGARAGSGAQGDARAGSGALGGAGVLVDAGERRFVAATVFASLQQRLAALLGAVPELPSEEARQRLGLTASVWQAVLDAAVAARRVVRVGALVRLAGATLEVDPATAVMRARVLPLLKRAALAPLSPDELARRESLDPTRLRAVLQGLVGAGQVVRAGDFFFDAEAVRALEARVRAHFAQHAQLTTQQFKALVGGSRKYAIPLAEYFDRERVTLRVGEVRTLRRS